MSKTALMSVIFVAVSVSLTGCNFNIPGLESTPMTQAERDKVKVAEEKALEQRLLSELRAMRANGRKDPNEAFQLVELVKLYSGQKRFAEAQLLIARARQSWAKTHHPSDAGVTYLLSAEADLLKNMGRIAQAEKLHLQALAINQKLLDADSPKLVPSLRQVGTFYLATNNYKKAEPYIKRALNICNTYPEERSPEVYKDLASSYGKIIDHQKQAERSTASKTTSM